MIQNSQEHILQTLVNYVELVYSSFQNGLSIKIWFYFLAESPDWLFPAMILMALGGNQLRMCGMQFGDLFPAYRSTAITVMSGVYATSASLFLIFKVN